MNSVANGATVNGTRRVSRRRVTAARAKRPLGLWLVYLAWAVTLFDLHYFLGNVVASPLGRLGTLVFLPLVVVMLAQGPALLGSLKPWVWYAPFLLLVVSGVVSMGTAINITLAKTALQYLVLYYVLAVATSMYIRTPRDALPVIAMLWTRFLWWAFWARSSGAVPWHPTLYNYDGFGGLMVQGTAMCFWFALAVSVRWKRFLLFGLAAYCTLGVVASFARGAFLALVVVAFVVWLRSPKKALTAVGMVAAVAVVVLSANLLFDSGAFWKEMASVFEEGTEEGTGAHRWALWTAATKVWLQHPLFGVGAANFGVFASQYFQPGEIEGFDNPAHFWGLNLHNAYFQILSELGAVGAFAFAWAMWDFVQRNRQLRTPEARARWEALGMSKRYDLHFLSLALEGSLLATFLVNVVYASFFEPWFISAWAANRMLWAITTSDGALTKPRPVRRASARVSAAPALR